MQTPHLRGGSLGGPSEGKHESEEAILDTMLASMARGALPAEAWAKLHTAAQDEHRLSELAFGFESVSQGKRLKTLPPPVAAEFFFQAANFFGDVFSDDMGAVTYLERALALAPTHSASFAKIEHILRKTEQPKKLSEVYVAVAQHRPRGEQAPLLRRAAEVLSKVEGAGDKVIELLQQAARLDPGDALGRARLEALYLAANRLRDVARLNEQALTAEPPPEPAVRKKLLSRIVEVYADKLNEPERALPHVEQLLAMDPMHAEARTVAQRLVGIKGLAARAASALATASDAFGTPQETARYVTIELEHTRGAKRIALLLKLGKLKHQRMGDAKGAFELFDQAIAIDPGDDDLRAHYLAAAGEIGAWGDAAKTLGRALSSVKDASVKAKVSAHLGAALHHRGDSERATLVLSGVLAAPEAPVDAVLAAARTLRVIHEEEKDAEALCDVLEWIAELEPDDNERRAADERLAEVASELNDTNRAIAAYERLLPTAARARALEALAALYEASGEPDKRASLLDELAKSDADPARARDLMTLAADLRAKESEDTAVLESVDEGLLEEVDAGDDAVELAAREPADDAVELAAREPADDAVELAAREPADDAVELAAREPGDDAVEPIAPELGDEDIALATLERPTETTRGAALDEPRMHEDDRIEPWLPRALALYQRTAEGGSASLEDLAATARLALASGDPEQALSALRLQRARTGGRAPAIDLEIARVLLARTNRPSEALAVLGSVLGEVPNDPTARALAARLLGHEETRSEATRVLDRACDEADDGSARARILECLLDAPAGPADANARAGWFARLIDVRLEGADPQGALATTIRAVRELPEVVTLWDRAEELARTLGRPDEVTALYDEVLARPLPRDQALRLGQRAVQFHDEWFEDSAAAVRILERVLEREPSAEWAFNRLKLRLDALERWDELFALYDRALDAAPEERRDALLQEAALTAKDFADRPDHAIRYLEELVHRSDGDPSLVNALERLYDRQGRHRELVALLTARLPSLKQEDRLRARARIAALSLDELGDVAAALDIIEPALRTGPWDDQAAPELRPLLERILEAVPPAADRSPDEASVRQRAAAWLRGHYARAGRDADLARMVLVQLEAAPSAEERVRCHLQIADLYERLGDETAALEHVGLASTLDPGDAAKRAKLVKLATSTERFDRLADFLSAAASATIKPALGIALTIQAAAVRADRLNDAGGAIALLASAVTRRGASNDDVVAVGRRLESLLDVAGRAEERLGVLERLAAAEPVPGARRETLGKAGHLAARLGQSARAIALWQTRLAADDRDVEALDALVDLFERTGEHARLAVVLTQRARVAASDSLRRADRVRVARLLSDVLGRPQEAIATWREVERDFGEADDAVVALTSLLRSTQRWQELVTLLERAAERTSDGATRAELWRQIGDVQQVSLGAHAAAASAFARALHADPRNAGARAGLLLLASDDAHRAAAVDVLLGSLRASEDWRAILDLTDLRLRAAASDGDKLAILLETMEIAEGRAADARLAFETMRRAFAIGPSDPRVQSETARLADAVGGWRALVDSYQEAIEGAARGDAWLVAQLRAWAGAVLESRLEDPSSALAAYVQVVADTADIEAGCAAVRVAGQLARWPVAAKVVVDLARAQGAPSRELFAAYERAASASGLWDEAVQALEERVMAGAVGGSVGRDIEARIAEWHRDRRGDPGAAQAAYYRALAQDDTSARVLEALAALQRRDRGEPLVHTLLRLSEAVGGDMALLREAAEVARDSAGDRTLARSILTDLLALARDRYAVEGDPRTVALAEWAVEGLARLHEQEGDALALVNVLAEGDRLPLEPTLRRSMRRRAARIALERLADHRRAIALYLAILDDDPQDTEAVDRLLSTYAAHGYTRDLLGLRERQIDTATDTPARIVLRLEAARLLGELGEPARAAAMLRANLEEDGRHAGTVDALVAVLMGDGRPREVCDLLEEQALFAEAGGDDRRAADHWCLAGTIAEQVLHTPTDAEGYHSRAVALEARAGSLDALARLATARADHPAAAQWLERLLDVVDRGRRVETILRLCDALVASSEIARAIERLQQELHAVPATEPLRARLVTLYREAGAWAQLARILTDGAGDGLDKPTRIARLLEAASLLSDRCGEPALAVPILERASALTPEDHAVSLLLAEALTRAERLDEARAILQSVVASFGRRRPKPRAAVHARLARLELAAGDLVRAMIELETAASIDQDDQEILRTLAETARDAGHLDAAEKAYRALLDGLRRHGELGEAPGMARSEVLLELHALAEQRGDSARAAEILESALETSAREDYDRQQLEGAHAEE